MIPAMMVIGGGAAAQNADLWGMDPLTKVMRNAAPPTDQAPACLEGARGEIVSGQVAFRPAADAKSVSAAVTDLKNGGQSVPAACVAVRWVRYIDIDRNTDGVPADELVARAPCSIPDPYWEGPTVDVAAGIVQPLWIEIDVPRSALAGEYSGTLTFRWDGGSASLPIKLTVWDFDLPTAPHQQVTNWFAFPGEGYSVAPDSTEYWDLLAKFAQAMVAHRQTCFLAFLGEIKTAYDPDNGYVCDFTKLDRWAQVFFDAGMQRVELAWAGTPTLIVNDPAARVLPVDLAVEVKDPSIKLTPEEKLRGIMEQVEKHVRAKGWQGKVMVHICDEPFVPVEPSYRKIARIVREAAPSLKVIEAVETTGLADVIDILVPTLHHISLWWQPYFEQAKREGREVWFYTCCEPRGRYPNRFLDQPLVKMRELHWIGYLYGLDGYLHWGLNHQTPGLDPYSQEGISQGLPLGDRAIMYPGKSGPVGSIRWSAMRDGLQDYEYLWVLQDRVAQLKKRLGDGGQWIDPRQRPLELCKRVVTSFYDHSRNPNDLFETRRAIAREIEALGRPDSVYVQTEPPEGTTIPFGVRVINVRGVAEPGATVKVNGIEIHDVGADGTFVAARYINDPTVTIEVSKDGKTTTVTRTFRFVD
jgi:hypothetical protein